MKVQTRPKNGFWHLTGGLVWMGKLIITFQAVRWAKPKGAYGSFWSPEDNLTRQKIHSLCDGCILKVCRIGCYFRQKCKHSGFSNFLQMAMQTQAPLIIFVRKLDWIWQSNHWATTQTAWHQLLQLTIPSQMHRQNSVTKQLQNIWEQKSTQTHWTGNTTWNQWFLRIASVFTEQ